MAAVAKKTGGKPIEVWFADEARIGQKNKITRRWAKRGTRPSAPRDQRTASAYIFGAICLQEGKGAALVLPSCNSEAMALHLEEIAMAVAPGAHAILVLDPAGWHISKAARAAQYNARATAGKIARVEPSREHLAIHERQLAVEPHLQILPGHPRPLLLRLEQAHRPALAHHVNRNTPMGQQVIIRKTWY